MYYTYAHVRNDTNQIFYIGKGIGRRMFRKDARNNHWHNLVKKAGYHPIIIAKWENEKDAFEHEKFLIECFKGQLVNQSSGGDGNDASGGLSFFGRQHSHAAKEKCRQAHLGKPKTETSKKLNAIAHEKKIQINGVIYDSWKKASNATGIPMGSISYLLKGVSPHSKWHNLTISLVM